MYEKETTDLRRVRITLLGTYVVQKVGENKRGEMHKYARKAVNTNTFIRLYWPPRRSSMPNFF